MAHVHGQQRCDAYGGTGDAGAHQTAQAPRLRSAAGSNAAWKQDMEVYLERIGANGVYKRAMTDEQWKRMTLQVQSWNDEALAHVSSSTSHTHFVSLAYTHILHIRISNLCSNFICLYTKTHPI